jgi:hypothetical protein
MKPLLANKSWAVVSLRGKRPDFPSEMSCVAEAPPLMSSPVEDASAVAPLPGCFTIPKLLGYQVLGEPALNQVCRPQEGESAYIDFLWDWTLHDNVFPSSTWTQRTI